MGGQEGSEAQPVKYEYTDTQSELYDLVNDVSETENVIDQFPEKRVQLEALADSAREVLGDKLTERTGKGDKALRPIRLMA